MTQTQKIATEMGMAGGTLTGIIATYSNDILKTIICAAIGAATSFVVTFCFKIIVKKIFKK